ncbi:small subunit processome component 20 homolog [Procambarus clarkii]|uniref:small subunit processome component 20 homolog n=1 Tax=Procambarus clarkii TaxID=6728 RepID=UPI001E671637|nr:small subunit processome component 20 homolog [Procambarus clarkii]XP_045584637.1 small subunit processome component 20 homolog [Procambarus clarkii]
MKEKPQRQAHKSTNTFTFRGFGEKVRNLKVSARKFLLQRPQTEDGESVTIFFQTLLKCREVNLTEAFQAFQNDLGGDIQTTVQLVHQEKHVAKCLADHLATPNSLALQALLDLLVAFANDIPQEFYQHHFYEFLPRLVSQLSTKDPEQIESVFLCIVSLFVVLQKYLRDDLYELYHVHQYATLLSKAHPWYINELAAQSLAFLIRKIPKRNSFLAIAFRKLKKDESQVQGLGRLIAALIKSDVAQRLQSVTPQILSSLLDLLGDEDIPTSSALETIAYALKIVAGHITAQHPNKHTKWQTLWQEDATMVWPTLWRSIQLLVPSAHLPGNSWHHLHAVLQVIEVLVSYKHGVLLVDVSDALNQCKTMVQISLPDSVGGTVFNIFSILLLSSHHQITSSTLKDVVSELLSSHYSHVVKFNAIKQLVDHIRFDTEILPLVLHYLNNLVRTSEVEDIDKEVLSMLAFLVQHKQPPCSTGMDLDSWRKYPLDFSRTLSPVKGVCEKDIPSLIENRLSKGLMEDLSNLEELLLCLLCLPHVSPLDYQDVTPYLTWILSDAIEILNDKTEKVIDDDKTVAAKKKGKSETEAPNLTIDLNIKYNINLNSRKILFLVAALIEVMLHTLTGEDFLASLSQYQILEVLKVKQQYRENVYILKAIDLHFTVASSENDSDIMNEIFFKDIYYILAPALCSANPQVRLLVTHIFSLFPVTLPPPPENMGIVENMFQIMLKAECVEVTPWAYKDRLRYLSMVDADHVVYHRPICGTFDQAPLLLLLGQLYINYKDVWNSVLQGISSYAHSLKTDMFWPLWFSRLKIASYNTSQVLQGKTVDPQEDLFFENEILLNVVQNVSTHHGFKNLPLKPDYLNYRDLLWRAMKKFPDICEAKSRDLVPLFFNFLEEELFPADFTVAPTQNLCVRSISNTAVTSEDLSNSALRDASFHQNVEKSYEENKIDHSTPRRAPIKSLCEQLTVFSQFHNPRMLFQTKKLEKMYKEFLSHPSPALQKLALDCIMAYNHPYLTPYKESLCKILDDKSFKNALTLFSIDGSEQCVQDDHRNDLMPFLMRILYGKMHFKTGSNSSGKAKISVRKSVVLRFLAGARESELNSFLELSFDVLMSHLNGTALDVVNRCCQNLDITKVVPLSRLQGALTTLENIIEKIGNILTDQIPFLLKIILYIVNLVSLLLEQRAEINERNISFLKHLRQQAQKRLLAFFQQFRDYHWSLEEIDAVFQAAVWPNLKRLPDEGISTPTPLLGLFQCWAENPRFFPLFAKCHKDDSSLTPLPYLVKLLNHEKCSDSVTAVILNIMEKLLTLEDYSATNKEGEKTVEPLPLSSHVVPVTKLDSRDGKYQQNYGSALLVPHLDSLLQSMKVMISKLGKGRCVTHRDLTILTKLTEWLTNKDISNDLLSLIIPLIVKKHIKKEDKICQLLITCSYLLPVIDSSIQYLRPLVTQLGCLKSREARDALCQAITAIAMTNPDYKTLADAAADLNSWNPKMVEEIDFERRLSRYQQLTEYCKTQQCLNKVDVDFCQLLLYNNMFVICHVEDSSLRDLSSVCLNEVTDMLARLQPTHPSEFKQLMVDRFLPLIKLGLQSEKEVVRIEIISVLRLMVHKCHEYIDTLKDLYKLADEIDEDSDFFSNMGHIQRHRRARALGKLADALNNGTLSFTTQTVTDFLMPLVTSYLFKDMYAKEDYLISSSVNCIGAFAKLLPWHPYQKMLRNYLSVLFKEDLKHLKLGVRLLDAVLNGFHEDVEELDIAMKKKSVKYDSASQSVQKNEQNMSEVGESVEEDGEDDHSMRIVEDSVSKPQKIYCTLVNTIIPQIQSTLAAKTKAETEHKLNKSRYPEDEDIKRIPLAFALIKLLKKLPRKVLNANVNNVLMKMITFLKSKAESIREESRNMLVKIMVELGGRYLPWLVNDLQSILTSGFQAHVLVYTLHSVLSQLRPVLTPKDVDACMAQMVNICKEDILGLQAEEKQVIQITSKVKEARSDKGYDILCFTAEFISADRLRDIILPLKDVLADTQDKKVVNKMTRCLTEIAKGLEKNENISITHKSIFIYGILNEKLTEITTDKTLGKLANKKGIQRADSFLLQPEPKRTRLNPKTSMKATAHVLIEFALHLLCNLMKKEKLIPKELEHQKLLEPYVSVLARCINSEYPEVSLQALKCVTCIVKFPLLTLQKELKNICAQMFIILDKFSSPELAKGKIYDLVQFSFKTLALILKTVEFYLLNEEEVRVLLQYVEGNLEDRSQQQTAFIVLQAIVARKIDAPELHELMKHVREMSITCGRQYALQQARITYYTYLLTYPMKPKRVEANVLYFLGNVSYTHEEGRLSATTMINAIIANFPIKVFSKAMETSLWFKLSEQMLKDESKENLFLLHKALKTLFQRSQRKEMLIELCMKLLEENDGNAASELIGIQLASKALNAFLDIPVKQLPNSLLSCVTPQIIKLISPSRYRTQLGISNEQDEFDEVDMDVHLRQIDTTLSALLEVLTKLVSTFLSHTEWNKHVNECMWDFVQAHLQYPHIQVRLSAAGLIGHLLAAHPIEGESSPSLAVSTERARSLVLDLCELLRTQASAGIPLVMQLSLTVIRNLIYLVRHSCKVSLVLKSKKESTAEGESENIRNENQSSGKETIVPSAVWVIRRVGDMAYEELQKSGKDYTVVREALLNLMAGLVVAAGDIVKAPTLLTYMVKHLVRELSDEHVPKSLAARTQEVAALVKECVGLETYTRYFTAAQVVLSKKRWERRAQDHQQRAINPHLAVKKKKKKQESFKESKKRRTADRRGKVVEKKNVTLRRHAVVMV